ncbi:MAG: hypothetical protein ACP5US_01145 [Candidatus Kryptoniota bacterium]
MNNLLLLLFVFAVFFAVALPTVLTDFTKRNRYGNRASENGAKDRLLSKKSAELK